MIPWHISYCTKNAAKDDEKKEISLLLCRLHQKVGKSMALMPGKNIMCTSTNLYNSQNVSEEMETVELLYTTTM